jgi:ParB family chromosome partitioning protein
MSNLYQNSIFWIDVEKINPNPYQPRREFDEGALRELADSIRQYGILQPLTVSRVEKETPDGGLLTEYELIAGERRLRASKLAGLSQVPVVIRIGDDNQAKLELAIIENLQREDLNAVDRAKAFARLVNEFGFTHTQIGKKVGKSREYVSNTMRLLQLPEEILQALAQGKISEGHTRPIMMLNDKPEEQMVLFKEIFYKKITVREAERIARNIATDRARKKETLIDPEISELEKKLQNTLGTRVHIERRDVGGQIRIDFFSPEDLHVLLDIIDLEKMPLPKETMLDRFISKQQGENVAALEVQPTEIPAFTPDPSLEPVVQSPEIVAHDSGAVPMPVVQSLEIESSEEKIPDVFEDVEKELSLLDDRTKDEMEKSEQDTDLYNIKNFSL